MSRQIKEFQSLAGLKADGIIGKNTLAKMRCDFGSLTDSQLAHFLSQTDHETGGFNYSTENLNYSATRLMQVFKKYFPTDNLARQYANNPEKIANRVYANRMGNGNEASGDGWKYRGRGSIQLTGKDNYTDFSKWIEDKEVLTNPDIVATEYFWDAGLYYFTKNNIWKQAKYEDANSVKAIRKVINGGYNGLQDVQDKFAKYLKLVKG